MNRWIERWYGSGPERGWSIWEMVGSTHGDQVAYVGEGEHSGRLARIIVQKHNDSLLAAQPATNAAEQAGERGYLTQEQAEIILGHGLANLSEFDTKRLMSKAQDRWDRVLQARAALSAAPARAEPTCMCGQPWVLNTVHRENSPCWRAADPVDGLGITKKEG